MWRIPNTPTSDRRRISRRKRGKEFEDEIEYKIFDIALTERKNRLAIKFSTNDGKMFVHTIPPDTPLDEINAIVAALICVNRKRLKPIFDKLKLMEEKTLQAFKEDRHDAIMCMFDSETFRIKFSKQAEFDDLVIPDKICVHVKDSTMCLDKCVPVQIYNRAIDRVWAGGYRNIKTGVEYYNAFSQTGPKPSGRPPELRNHCDSQTSYLRNRKLCMPYSRTTQTNTKELYIPSLTDRFIEPKPYGLLDKIKFQQMCKAVRIIQRYYRSWKIRKNIKLWSTEYRLRKAKELEKEQKEQEEDWKRRRRDLICQVFPRTKMDFSMLYAMTDKWKQEETESIYKRSCGPARNAELALLSDKESQLLLTIDKLYNEVRRDYKRQRDVNHLTKLGKPVVHELTEKFLPVAIDTLENQEARRLDLLYQRVIDRSTSETKRMDALLELKIYLRNDDCDVSVELNTMINAALTLLSRGFSNSSIEVLQRRIDMALLYHFKQKDCFPLLNEKKERDERKNLRTNLFVCVRCRKMKTHNPSKINARRENVNVCSTCRWMDKTLEPWADLSPYRYILEKIRRYENLKKTQFSVAYILRDRDIHHIVTKIWHSHSAISENGDIYKLRLVRWDPKVPWSPWNCILLTADEAKAHLSIKNLESVYEEDFFKHVFNKHALAKQHFKDLTSIESQFTEIGKMRPVHIVESLDFNDQLSLMKHMNKLAIDQCEKQGVEIYKIY